MPDKYFSIDGVATFVRHTGATTLPEVVPDTSHGHAILCLHDAGGNSGEFAALLDALSQRHSPFAFDLPGHARSGGLDSLASIERMAEFTARLCEVLSLERPVLFGCGMGAAVALCRALASSDAARALVICAGAARFAIPDEKLEQTRRVCEGKEQRPFDRSVYASGTSPEVMRQGFLESLKTDPRVLHGDLVACCEWNAESRLAQLRLPTLVIVGEEESEPLRKQAELLCTKIPGARKVEIPKAGHALLLEQAEAVADALRDFLARVPA